MARRRRKELDRRAACSRRIPVDLLDRGDEYVLVADLPGYRTQDIDVAVKKARVELVADPDPDGPTGDRPSVRRVVRLPEWVREKRATASYERGVLRVRLPKRTDDPHRVSVE